MTSKDFLELSDLPKSVKQHIKQLERVRRDFVANVSHELRTPLTVIRGYLETLTTREDEQTKQYQKIFSQMYQHSIRMENIIADLLLLSRLESEEQTEEQMTVVNINELLKNLCQEAESISGAKQHQISLNADAALYIKGSENELKSLFSNLIINAIKYTPAKGCISIQWCKEGAQAVFKVSDTGIGIAEKDIPRITERFYRVDKARSRESGGTGLGLAIVKHVLMRHQAQLKIESKEGEGSTFSCYFSVEGK